jgi:hypothetical protein
MNPQSDALRQIRRLQLWNRFWICLFVVSALYFAAQNQIRRVRTLTVAYNTDGSVKFRSFSDGPFVITHLALSGDGGVGARATAALTPPLTCIDSSGAYLSQEEVSRLVWRDDHGEKMRAPSPGSKLAALYFDPQIAKAPER